MPSKKSKKKSFKNFKTDISKVKKAFSEQEKKYDFRSEELKNYRKEAKKVYEKNNILERFNDAVKSENVLIRKITEEKKENRNIPYGKTGLQFKIEFNSRLERFLLVARNNKGEIISSKEFEKPKISKQIKKLPKDKKDKRLKEIDKRNIEKQTDILRKRIEKRGFEYNKVYIKEDLEPEKKTDKRINIVTSYSSYYRLSCFIYRMRDSKKYELIFQFSDVQSRSVYVSYQRIIAELKDTILRYTGLTLEEWITISRIRKDIYIEGGIRFKRFKMKRNIKIGKTYYEKLDYDIHIDFSDF